MATRKPKPGKSLGDLFPHLIPEWDVEKNGDLTPFDVASKSGIRIWWLCSHGHEWQESIEKRTKRGYGCPYCSGQRLQQGVNDLLTTHPWLAAEWHPKRNGDLTPSDVSYGSSKKVWWLGECGHEWTAVISSRAYGRGCPVCARETRTSFPQEAISYELGKVTTVESRANVSGFEVDVYLPDINAGIEYDGDYWHGNSEASAARDARKNEVLSKRLSKFVRVRGVRVKSSDCNVYWQDGILRYDYGSDYSGIAEVVRELCRVLQLPVMDCDILSDEGAIYSRYLSVRKANSVGVLHPDLREQWAMDKNGGVNPDYIAEYSNRSFWWRCSAGHEWRASVSNRVKGNGCPYCAGQKAIVGVNDLGTLDSALAAEWHPVLNGDLTPSDVMCQTNRAVWWLGPCGHEWKASIANRHNKHVGCPICAGQKIAAGINDVGTKCPWLVDEWDWEKNGSLRPDDFTSGSGKMVWWKCKVCGYEWQTRIDHRAAGHGCPSCARRGTNNGCAKAVRCVETNDVFATMRDAANAVGVKGSSNIGTSIRKGSRCGGYHWELIETDNA